MLSSVVYISKFKYAILIFEVLHKNQLYTFSNVGFLCSTSISAFTSKYNKIYVD